MKSRKPKHWETVYAEQFKDESIVNAYHHRPDYPDALFPFLAEMTIGEPKRVLDAGCGLGNIARPLTNYVQHVDAVDFSEQMIAQGKQLPNGDALNLNWICSPVETAPFVPPYGLITAGQSLHWFDWEVALPLFADLLVPDGCLMIIERKFANTPWGQELAPLIAEFSTNQDYQPCNLVDELEKRYLFQKQGEKTTQPIKLTKTISDYIEALHSGNGLSRERMPPEKAQAFDEAVRNLVQAHIEGEVMEGAVSTPITWGFPTRGNG